MASRTTLVAATLVFLSSGCLATPVDIGDFGVARGDRLETRDVAFFSTNGYHFATTEYRVYTSEWAWNGFWRTQTKGSEPRSPAPEVDWKDEFVVIVAIEEQPSAQDDVAIRSVQWDGDAIHVSYSRIELEPSPDCTTAQIVNQPLHGVAVTRPTSGALRIAFHEALELRACGT